MSHFEGRTSKLGAICLAAATFASGCSPSQEAVEQAVQSQKLTPIPTREVMPDVFAGKSEHAHILKSAVRAEQVLEAIEGYIRNGELVPGSLFGGAQKKQALLAEQLNDPIQQLLISRQDSPRLSAEQVAALQRATTSLITLNTLLKLGEVHQSSGIGDGRVSSTLTPFAQAKTDTFLLRYYLTVDPGAPGSSR